MGRRTNKIKHNFLKSNKWRVFTKSSQSKLRVIPKTTPTSVLFLISHLHLNQPKCCVSPSNFRSMQIPLNFYLLQFLIVIPKEKPKWNHISLILTPLTTTIHKLICRLVWKFLDVLSLNLIWWHIIKHSLFCMK